MSEAPTISADRSAAIGPGRFVLVVGPSGAGKDTLLGLARAACANDTNLVFPRRIVTREASAFEDNEQIGVAAFQQAVARDAYAVHWQAHDHRYALPRTIDGEIRAGKTVIANVSRTVIDAIRDAYADVVVVTITAPPEILAQRLAARSRGSDGKIEDRLQRIVVSATAISDFTIDNIGNVEDHARRLVRIINGD